MQTQGGKKVIPEQNLTQLHWIFETRLDKTRNFALKRTNR